MHAIEREDDDSITSSDEFLIATLNAIMPKDKLTVTLKANGPLH